MLNGAINYRNYVYLYILMLLTLLILMKFLRQSSVCYEVKNGDVVRVYKSLIVSDWSENSVKKLTKGPLVIRNIKKQEKSPDLSSGDVIVVEGRVDNIQFWSSNVEEVHLLPQNIVHRLRRLYKPGSIGKYQTPLNIYGCEIRLTEAVIVKVEKNSHSGIAWFFMLLDKLRRVRELLLQMYARYLTEPHASLAYGVLFGDTPTMPSNFYNSLVQVGILHVVAASGYNVSVIMAVTTRFFQYFLKSKKIILAFSALVVIGYMFLAGFSPSIVRAGVMGILIVISQLFGRVYSGEKALFITTLIMLLSDPYLVANASFQLSVASTWGIMCLLPLLRADQSNSHTQDSSTLGTSMQNELKNAFFTTVAASITTVPIILYRFGQFSTVSVIANTTLLWIIPILMMCSALFVVATLLFPWIGAVFAIPTWVTAQLFVSAVTSFERLPFASHTFENVSLLIPLLWYAVVIVFWRWRSRHVKTD